MSPDFEIAIHHTCIWVSGSRVLGFRAQGLGLRVEECARPYKTLRRPCTTPVVGFWVLGFGFWVLGFGFWVLGFGFWVLGFGFWVLGFRGLGFRA